jgi:phenylalanyl-tRNA synthetase beta chain
VKISPEWLRDFVSIKADDHQLANDLTHAGIAVESVEGEGTNTVYEMDITTNRVDAMNHYGVAREAAAIYDLELKPIQPKIPHVETRHTASQSSNNPTYGIEIEQPDLCRRFTARGLRGIAIRPSPEKLQKRLEGIGSHGINNAVDATNYILWEMGKPTHVFDLDLLEGGKLVIRFARDGEKLKTLDGIERKLTKEDLVVVDAKKPVGLAGVMGGFDTMITERTKNILIESAWWDPLTTRRMAKRHGLHTDASHRFERGADIESTVLSTNRVAELILASGGGQLEGDVIDVYPRPLQRPTVHLRCSEVKRILGRDISEKDIARILTRLGFTIAGQDNAGWKIKLPSWRLDVDREIDVIEEIARIYGYDNFKNTLPTFAGAVIEHPDAARDAKLRSTSLALGYNEAVSLTFIAAKDAENFSSAKAAALENPLSEEASVMRTSLLPGMLDMLAHNLNRGQEDVRLFEAGHVFELASGKTSEHKQLALGATTSAISTQLCDKSALNAFRACKGEIESLLENFQHESLSFDTQLPAYFHPGRAARAMMDGETVAQFGQVHPEVATARKIKQDVYVAELFLDKLYRHELHEARYQAASKFPAVERDFSFVFDDATSYQQVEQAVRKLKIAELQQLEPIELFRPDPKSQKQSSIPAGKYSLLLRTTFQSNERTLRDEEVTRWSEQIIKALQALSGTQRA